MHLAAQTTLYTATVLVLIVPLAIRLIRGMRGGGYAKAQAGEEASPDVDVLGERQKPEPGTVDDKRSISHAASDSSVADRKNPR